MSAAWPVATTSTWLLKREEQPSTSSWTCSALVVVVDVLLHLVKDHQGQRQLAGCELSKLQYFLERVKHFVIADVVDHGELGLQCSAHCSGVFAEGGAGVDQRLGKHRRHVQVAKLVLELFPLASIVARTTSSRPSWYIHSASRAGAYC